MFYMYVYLLYISLVASTYSEGFFVMLISLRKCKHKQVSIEVDAGRNECMRITLCFT